LVLDEVHYRPKGGRTERDLHDLLQPVSTVLVPIFFVLMGMKVDLRLFGRLDILGFAAMLTIAAIIGKQVCGLAVLERGINRLAVGLGMIPRGEVGLIFADIGRRAGVLNEALFGAILLMVMATTFVAPPGLKLLFGSRDDSRTS
jgi:Kef-type K+ transport system membrane component KefB